MTNFDMDPVEVSQEILDGLKAIPTATVYNALRNSDSDSVVKFKNVLNKIINE